MRLDWGGKHFIVLWCTGERRAVAAVLFIGPLLGLRLHLADMAVTSFRVFDLLLAGGAGEATAEHYVRV